MSVPGSANALLLNTAAAGGYQISRSLRFNSSDSAYLSRTPASAGNRKTWTWAGWVKRSSFNNEIPVFSAYTNVNDRVFFGFISGDILQVFSPNGATINLLTTAVFRDPSAWYHVTLAFDTTQSTAANRVRLYVNGIQQTFSGTSPAQNTDWPVGNNIAHYVGFSGSTFYLNAYLADIHFIDGQALDPTSFGEFDTNGIWQPKRYSGTYGTNGFHLEFADNSSNTATTLGKDTSGNGNNWTPNNLSVTAGAGNDSLVDVPTNGVQPDTGAGGEVRGNYCTLNPLDSNSSNTLSNGNLDITRSASSWSATKSTVFIDSGKWYWEITRNSGGTFAQLGVATASASLSEGTGDNSNSWCVQLNGQKRTNNSASSYGNAIASGDVVMVAVDATGGSGSVKIWWGLNGTWFNSGSPSSGTNAAFTNLPTGLTPAMSPYGGSSFSMNYGARSFAYTAPSGFKALCTANLPAPVVTKPSSVFDVVTYTGTGSTLTPTSSLGFNPDLVWIKSRSAATDHTLYDSVRGAQARLESNTTDAEVTSDNGLTAFNSNGFTLGTLAQVNTNAATYVGWTWDAGSSTVTNTQGSITSSVRANASAGFSIVTYTGNGTSGATIGHGLGIAPEFFVVKSRSLGSTQWFAYHKYVSTAPQNDYLNLASTAAKGTASSVWNNTAPSSTLITLGNDVSTNNNTQTFVCYAFAPVVGYSSFGSYTGNGSTDGPFVYTGFRPRFILVKRTDSSAQWVIYDSVRDSFNVGKTPLAPNEVTAESGFISGYEIDILSNGFKVRNGPTVVTNASGGTYVYAAFAESPFQYARAR